MSKGTTKITTEDIYSLLKEVNTNLTAKIGKVEEEIKSIKTTVEVEISDIKQELNIFEKVNKDLHNNIEEIQRKLKANNIVVYGLEEKYDENQKNLIEEFLNLVNNVLIVKLTTTDINNIFRLGRNRDNTRPVLVSLVSYIKKVEILSNCIKLKGKKIYVSEDLTEKGIQERKILVAGLIRARRNNKTAKIKGNKLVVDGEKYTVEEVEIQNQNCVGDYQISESEEVSSQSDMPLTEEPDVEAQCSNNTRDNEKNEASFPDIQKSGSHPPKRMGNRLQNKRC